MKVGIVFHSQTGTTRNFAETVAKALQAKGHTADVLEISAETDIKPHQADVRLKSFPDCSGYDALMIGGPIWAFGISPVPVAFAAGLKDLAGKKVLPFATMGAPVAIMGGTQGMSRMKRCLEKSGATVLQGVVGTAWARRTDEEKQKVVARIEALLGA